MTESEIILYIQHAGFLRSSESGERGMKWLKQMVETVRSNGKGGGLHVAWEGAPDDLYGMGTQADKARFFSAVERCHPFVFEKPIYFDWQGWFDLLPAKDDGSKLYPGLDSAPFPVFSIECLHDPLTQGKADPIDAPMVCMLAQEVLPLRFVFYCLYKHPHGERYWVSACNITGRVAEVYIEQLGKQALGLEAVREKIRLGSGKEKRIHTIRKLIRVCARKEIELVRPIVSREIDWTHRWLVRGHWRRTASIGKDRAGNYCVDGFTWVTEFEKGPKEAPLIADKTRYVHTPYPAVFKNLKVGV